MITIKAYIYENIVEVQVFDPTFFDHRNRIMYSRPIKVYQGIDNPIQIKLMNQDQKPVNMTGLELQVAIQDPTKQQTIKVYAVKWTDITKGLGNAVLDKNTLNSLHNRFYKLTFLTLNATSGDVNPVYINDNYGVPLDLEILPAYYATTNLTANSHSVIAGSNLGNTL
ncbi:MAG TPA: hypothetical protein VFM18_17195 [Methanosarcina sp.]|nr:hypothetical protein [Methanosarcina sp.]